jgi:F-type H+-transporting ATPase subunit delta
MSRVAIRYSKALFQLARERNKIDLVESELNLLSELIQSTVEFSDMLVNPLITATKKAELVSRLFKDKLDPLTYNFMILVCRNKRSSMLPEIIVQFRERVQDEKGIWQGKIICAHPLTRAQIEQISSRTRDLTGKTVLLQQQVDKNLIGGFIVKIKDTIIDLSVKGQLDRLHSKLISG